MDKERKNQCPKCGGNLLARSDNKIICLNPSCNWFIESKRKGDGSLPDFNELKSNWQ